MKILEEPEDEYHHFGMLVATKLRKLPSLSSDYAMTQITSLLYEVSYNSNSSNMSMSGNSESINLMDH